MTTSRYVLVRSDADHARRFKIGRYEGKGLYNKRSGYMIEMPQRVELQAPIVMRDVPEHVAPDGSVVSSRPHRTEVCKRNGWEPLEKVIQKGERETRPHGYVNETFTKKRGLRTCDKAMQWHASKKEKHAKAAGYIK